MTASEARELIDHLDNKIMNHDDTLTFISVINAMVTKKKSFVPFYLLLILGCLMPFIWVVIYNIMLRNFGALGGLDVGCTISGFISTILTFVAGFVTLDVISNENKSL